VTEITLGRSDHTAHSWIAATLCLNSQPEVPNHWGQIIPNLNNYHSDRMEISSTFWLPDITDWWRRQEEMHSMIADFSNVAGDILAIVPHGV
jgi:hypothetical protein